MLSARTRRARSRLATAVRRGENIEAARVEYDTERAIDVLHAIRGATTPKQQQRLHDAVDEAAKGDRS